MAGSLLLGPVHTYTDIFENGGFSSVLALRPHVNGVFGDHKRRFSNMLSRVKTFENAGFVFTCGWAKTEVFENDDVFKN